MPIVAVEIVAPAEATVMSRAMLDACSAAVRTGKCELSTDATDEPRLASATVRWSDPSERSVRIDVTGVAPDTAAVRLRVITFKDTDEIVERWRSVGLTIATLVGDALARVPSADIQQPPDPSGHAGTAGAPPGTARQSGAPPAVVSTPAGSPVPVPKEPAVDARAEGAERQDVPPAREKATPPSVPLPNRLWATVTGQTGPGLEEGGAFRFGAAVDVAFRPVAFPVFARVAAGYASRAADSQGLSVQWENANAGAGVVIGTGAFRAEPRVGVGIENVHARVVDAPSGKSDAGNSIGPSFQLGVDGVFQLGHFGFVASLEGNQKHARTQILVEGRYFGASPATTWAVGLGVRYYVE